MIVPPDLLREIRAVADRLRVDPAHLLAVIHFESAGTFDPSIKNPHSSATGLIQFLDATARELGTSIAALRSMTAVEQMHYVEKYLAMWKRRKGALRTAADVYSAVHWPAAIGKPDSAVIYAAGSSAYRANSLPRCRLGRGSN